MAVNPLTAKIIAQLAAKRLKQLTDEEERRKMLLIAFIPLIVFLLLVAFILYIVTSPLALLFGWLLPDELKAVEDFQKGYDYDQSAGIYEKEYTEEESGEFWTVSY